MEVVNNNQKLRVYWMYNDSLFPLLLEKAGYPEKDVEEMQRIPLKKQIELWNSKFPANPVPPDGKDACPDTTWCFLIDANSKTIASASVVRYYKDPEDRNKARKYALAKLLKGLSFGKEERKAFWDAYLNRSPQPAAVTAVAVAPNSGL
jgi:hypothetical protein